MMNQRSSILMKSLLGTVIAWIGTITAFQENVEWLVKVLAGLGTIAVSILTATIAIRSLRNKGSNKDKEPPK